MWCCGGACGTDAGTGEDGIGLPWSCHPRCPAARILMGVGAGGGAVVGARPCAVDGAAAAAASGICC